MACLMLMMAAGMTSCTDADDAVQVNYGIYATGDLLAVATPEVKVTNSDGRVDTWTLKPEDFKISNDFHITAGSDVTCYYWSVGDHFDKFNVESTLQVTFRPKTGVTLNDFTGAMVLGSGFAGSVSTADKDGDTWDKPIVTTPSATLFMMPQQVEQAAAYLNQMASSPAMVTVKVGVNGEPLVSYLP